MSSSVSTRLRALVRLVRSVVLFLFYLLLASVLLLAGLLCYLAYSVYPPTIPIVLVSTLLILFYLHTNLQTLLAPLELIIPSEAPSDSSPTSSSPAASLSASVVEILSDTVFASVQTALCIILPTLALTGSFLFSIGYPHFGVVLIVLAAFIYILTQTCFYLTKHLILTLLGSLLHTFAHPNETTPLQQPQPQPQQQRQELHVH